jgi:15,16-dihydrobiliverdin:ferredoxin oxidoreductase
MRIFSASVKVCRTYRRTWFGCEMNGFNFKFVLVLACICHSWALMHARNMPRSCRMVATSAGWMVGNSGNDLTLQQKEASIPLASNILFSLPWKTSIEADRDLTYMPMMEHQLDLMASLGFEKVEMHEQFVYRSSKVKSARIGNMCFRSEIFRKVRLTYFDAGNNVQVFNALFYPDYMYDLPLLGIDLISLGLNRVLSVVDFQPLHPTQEYSKKYIDHLASIRDKYPSLQGTLSGKIYDDTSFFSEQMLFGRYKDESAVLTEVLPAFKDYLGEYMALARRAEADKSPEAMTVVKERQTAYDTYSAKKDPAVGLFDAYFGKEWSANFVHDFLFTLSSSDVGSPNLAHNFELNTKTGKVEMSKRPQ